MKTLDQLCNDIVGREGGFVNDPNDSGGPTMCGISLVFARSLPHVNGKSPMDLNGDGNVDIRDIRLVTPAIAKKLYLQEFYYGNSLDKLPAAIQPILFDMGVNGGRGGAGHILQMALTSMGYRCANDGQIGPATIGVANTAFAKVGGPFFVKLLVRERIAFYEAIVAHNPKDAKFLKGWTTRAQSFLP